MEKLRILNRYRLYSELCKKYAKISEILHSNRNCNALISLFVNSYFLMKLNNNTTVLCKN